MANPQTLGTSPEPTRSEVAQPQSPATMAPPVQVVSKPSFLRNNWKFITALTASVLVVAAIIAFPPALFYSATAYLAANLPSFVSAAYAVPTATALVIATLASAAGLLTRGLLAAATYVYDKITKFFKKAQADVAADLRNVADNLNAQAESISPATKQQNVTGQTAEPVVHPSPTNSPVRSENAAPDANNASANSPGGPK